MRDERHVRFERYRAVPGAVLFDIEARIGELENGREHAITLLDALNIDERPPWTLVDTQWTPKQINGVMPDNSSSQIAG